MKTRKLIKFSEEAKGPAIELYNEIEASQQPGGRLEYAKDHGSKLFENITRLAGLLTYFEHGPGAEISLGILRDAERIAFHCSEAYLGYFKSYPDYIRNALELKAYFQQIRDNAERYFRKGVLRRSSLSFMRDVTARDQALEVLTNWGEIKVYTYKSGLVVIDLKPYETYEASVWVDFCSAQKLSQNYFNNPPIIRTSPYAIATRWA